MDCQNLQKLKQKSIQRKVEMVAILSIIILHETAAQAFWTYFDVLLYMFLTVFLWYFLYSSCNQTYITACVLQNLNKVLFGCFEYVSCISIVENIF